MGMIRVRNKIRIEFQRTGFRSKRKIHKTVTEKPPRSDGVFG